MEISTFTTNPRSLEELLKEAKNGKIQLPDFQRSWVWDEDRIVDLLASVSRAFPIGAVMTLKTGGEVNFHPRTIQGVTSPEYSPEELLLDGQQRITSIYQVAMRGEVVETTTIKHKRIKRWFYVDIRKAIDPTVDKTEAIFTVPEDKKLKASDAWPDGLDLTTDESEFEHLVFPLSETFRWSDWNSKITKYLIKNEHYDSVWGETLEPFRQQFIKTFENYSVPVISLGKTTSKEAVCTVFEKVNTGGKALDAFELVTAMYAADDYKLRDDWYGTGQSDLGFKSKISALNSVGERKVGVLSKIDSTDFLYVVSLFHTRDLRRAAEANGKQGRDLPQVTGKRAALLDLPLSAYKEYRDKAFHGFELAAKFLHMLNIFHTKDLPYQSQVIPIAAVLADIGDAWTQATVRDKLSQWFWCGVFGELYGSSVDTRIGNDFLELPRWFNGGDEPKTVQEANFHRDRLFTMRMRLSAAYKGVNALLMQQGAIDFRSGQDFGHTTFFDEAVDIHHVFPKNWCDQNGKDRKQYDSIVNKTPLSAKTNRIIGGVAPSEYLESLESGREDEAEGIDPAKLDLSLKSHLINPSLLRNDNYEAFLKDRADGLVGIIATAMKKPSSVKNDENRDWGEASDELPIEA